MVPTVRPAAPAPSAAPRPRVPAGGLMSSPTIVRTCRDSALFRGWGVKI